MFTVIDFSKTEADVENLASLPAAAVAVFRSAVRIESRGFQELIGYGADRRAVWSCGGHWTRGAGPQRFHITSMGNGEQLYVEEL